MRAGIGDHDCRQIGTVRFALGLHIGHVDIALLVTRHHHHLHADHLCARWVGAVCGSRYQTDIAMPLSLSGMVSTNDQQACVFTLAASIGLQADACVACGLA